VALNCVGNGKILASGIFDDIWIQPAAGDAGGALGGALLTWYQLLGREREINLEDAQQGSRLGPQFSNDEIRAFLDRAKAAYELVDSDNLAEKVSDYIIDQKVIGWFYGRMEFGPRALGSRSIIGDARSQEMQTTMNLKIKYRESFRPFAPCVLLENVNEYFDLDHKSPYMLLVAPVKADKRVKLDEAQRQIMTDDPDLRKRVNIPRSEIPAITHIDYSARVQTVDKTRHGRYYEMMKQFHGKTGCPVIINTSFNIRGEPIVCTPKDAYNCFMNTEMDVLVLENYILRKEDQPQREKQDVEQYKQSFKLD